MNDSTINKLERGRLAAGAQLLTGAAAGPKRDGEMVAKLAAQNATPRALYTFHDAFINGLIAGNNAHQARTWARHDALNPFPAADNPTAYHAWREGFFTRLRVSGCNGEAYADLELAPLPRPHARITVCMRDAGDDLRPLDQFDITNFFSVINECSNIDDAGDLVIYW